MISRDEHIDAKIALVMVDCDRPWNPKPMSPTEVANATGMTRSEVKLCEFGALKKLKKNPEAWEALMEWVRRTPPVL